MPRTYRLITFTVEAMQLTPERHDDAALWTGGMKVVETDPRDPNKKFVALNIPTVRGMERASEGDYIVKDASNGGFCVVKKRDFEAKYELAS
jgi:hypothetical protein